jgi:hypothetical protein
MRTRRASLSLATLLWGVARVATAQTPTPTLLPFSFGQTRLYPAGSEPVALAAGNFDGNALVDLVVLNSTGQSIMQFNNDGSGRFNRSGPEYSTGGGTDEEVPPYWIATLHKNTDATHEFIFTREPTEAETEAQDFEFFGRAETVRAGLVRLDRQTVGEAPTFVRAGTDLNGDGLEDAVVVNNFDDTLAFLRNVQAGGFVSQSLDTVTSPIGVAFGDFNGDGLPDVAALGDGGDLLIHRNLGGVTGANPRFLSCPTSNTSLECQGTVPALAPTALEALHVDGDGKLDLAIADSGAFAVVVLRGNGDGTFKPPETYDVFDSPEAIATGDFNGDGRVDIAVTLPDVDLIQVILGRSDGTFDNTSPPFATGPLPSSLVAADFNNDGRVDLATASADADAIAVILNGVSPPLFTPTITPTGTKTRTPTKTGTVTQTPTITLSPTRTPSSTVTKTATLTAIPSTTPTPRSTPCPGDCDGNGSISGVELQQMMTILNRCAPCAGGGGVAAGCSGVPGCTSADLDQNGCLSASELTRAVQGALAGGTCQ